MALSQKNLKTLIPTLLQSTATAYTTLGKGVLALDQLHKVSELLETVICSLKEEHGKYDDLIKVLSALAVQYKKLDIETKSHIRTVKEQAQLNTKIIDEAKQQLLKGNNISKHFVEIEQTVKESQMSSEELRRKYDVVIYKVKDCCSQAKAGYERNEHKADLAEKGASVGLLGGMGVGGTFAAFQVATKALCVFGVPGAVAGGALGLIGGCVVGGMVGGLPFATAEALFRKYAEKFKILDETLSQIDQILLENFEVLTEICRLLGKLKKAALSLSEAHEVGPNIIKQDEVDGCTKVKPLDESDHSVGSEHESNINTQDEVGGRSKVEPLVVSNHAEDSGSATEHSHRGIPGDYDTNIDFLIQLKFDTFKRASQELENNCDYLLDDMPLRALGLLSLDGKCKDKVTEKKKLN